jgi:hypothetical protein
MMKGGVSIKTIIVIVILILVGVLGVFGVGQARTLLSGAAGSGEPKGVVATPGEDGKTATIVWTTDKEVQGMVQYGTSAAALLLSAPETVPTTDHTVALSSLKPGQNYFFRIKVGEEVFDNGGADYSFRTTESVPTATPTAVATATPTIVSVPIPTAAVSSGTSCNRTTDYNKDGVVNTADYISCVRGGGGAAASTVICKDNVDYDGNGIINSLDKSKCLQSGK